MKEKVIIFDCPNCNKQNLVSERRLRFIEESPIKCWYCSKVIDKEYIEVGTDKRGNDTEKNSNY